MIQNRVLTQTLKDSIPRGFDFASEQAPEKMPFSVILSEAKNLSSI
jgi:hypothetical protein